MLVTEEEAGKIKCAKAVVTESNIFCIGSLCMAWRWRPSLSVNNPARIPGGAGQTINKRRGYCGAGKPEEA